MFKRLFCPFQYFYQVIVILNRTYKFYFMFLTKTYKKKLNKQKVETFKLYFILLSVIYNIKKNINKNYKY